MADIPDLGGRTAVVIGANGGPGWRPRVRVAAAGATVVLAARSPDKTAAAVDTIRAETPSAQLDVVALDSHRWTRCAPPWRPSSSAVRRSMCS